MTHRPLDSKMLPTNAALLLPTKVAPLLLVMYHGVGVQLKERRVAVAESPSLVLDN